MRRASIEDGNDREPPISRKKQLAECVHRAVKVPCDFVQDGGLLQLPSRFLHGAVLGPSKRETVHAVDLAPSALSHAARPHSASVKAQRPAPG